MVRRGVRTHCPPPAHPLLPFLLSFQTHLFPSDPSMSTRCRHAHIEQVFPWLFKRIRRVNAFYEQKSGEISHQQLTANSRYAKPTPFPHTCLPVLPSFLRHFHFKKRHLSRPHKREREREVRQKLPACLSLPLIPSFPPLLFSRGLFLKKKTRKRSISLKGKKERKKRREI